MKRLCDFYIRHAGLIGAIYCAVPALVWIISTSLCVGFRQVYLLRLGLCLVFGCAIAACLNRYGVNAWLCKHRSTNGPATVLDGALIGAAVGIGSALLPTLTALIRTNHPEMAKTFIIVTYLATALAGAVIGSVLATVGRKYIDRPLAGEAEGTLAE
jgi:hypothetical protein